MTQHRNLDYGQRLPEAFLDAIQELLGSYASPNFVLTLANATTVQIVAGAGDDQVCIAIDGRWRWRSSSVNAAHPGGAAGTHAVYVTASDNVFVPGTPEVDNTVYTFGLEIRTSGTPATALHRKVADVVWSGTAITSIIPLVPASASIGSVTTATILDGTIVVGDVAQSTWVAVNGTGLLAGRPAAAPGNAGYLYCATDVDGGSIYRSDGSAWTRFGAVNVLTAQIGDAQVTLAKLATNSVDRNKIVDGEVILSKLASDSVNALKIVDGSVGTTEIGDGQVTLAKLAANSVDAAKIVDGSVGAAEIADLSVGTAELADGAATLAKLAANSVDASKIVDGSVGAAEIADASVGTAEIATALKPSAGAAAGTEALRALGTAAGLAAAGTHAAQHGRTGADPLPADAMPLPAFNGRTGSYTLVATDVDKIVEMLVAGANTLTVPPNSTVAFPVGTQITVIQTGAGQTTLAPGAGVTLNASPGLKIAAQWGAATLIKRGTDVWVAVGNLVP